MSVEIVENLVNGSGSGSETHTDTSPTTSSKSSAKLGEESREENLYDDAFPSLPAAGGGAGASAALGSAWGGSSAASANKKQNTTQIIRVSADERRSNDSFGNETKKKYEEIASTHGVKIEMCHNKDQTLHVVISGREDRVNEAKRAIVNELKVETESKLKIPKEHHKFLIGKSGAILKDLQERTCTKIQVPKPDANTDVIVIKGLKEDVEQAVNEIQGIVDEQSKTSVERLNIPKLYHPWLRGTNNEIATDIATRTGAKVNIPPAMVEKDEIVVSGDREKVEAAVQELKRIYAAKAKLNVTKVALQINKSQHKLIIGKNGQTVHDIFKDYDVYVQVPKLDSPSDTILLFGEEAKLGAALSQVIAKSNSVVTVKIDVPSWLHRHMIGEKGANISKITADFVNTHVKFETDDKITIDGPPDEVEKVRERLEAITLNLKQVMTCEELSIDPKMYPQLLGQKKTDVHVIARLNKELGVVIRLPANAETGTCTSNVVRIEGPPDAVRKCKQELTETVAKLIDERSKDIIIDQKFHSNLIGKGGKTLNEIRSKFNDVQINIPAASEKSDVVTIRGNKNDVEKCYKYLQQHVKDMQESNYKEEIQIVKEFHRIIIGKGGAFIKKIRDDTHTRIDIPSNESESNAIVLTGKQENVLKAKALIEDKIRELVNIKEDYLEVPHQYHTALIGKQGHIIKQIRSDCGGVVISFPPESNANDDRIVLKGTAEDIKRAKAELLKLVDMRHELGYSEEISVRLDYHKFLVGRKGTNVNTLRDKHNVRIIFPSASNGSAENGAAEVGVITIIGKKESVKAARAELEESVKSLDEQITDELNVDPKWHKNFTTKRGKLISEISVDNCNVKISFPKGANETKVAIKGPKDAVESAKKRILDYVHRFENQVTIPVVIPQQYHAAVIGKKGANSQKISDDFHVNIQFHAKGSEANGGEHNQSQEGGENETATTTSPASSADNSPSKSNGSSPDTVLISGFKGDCEKAREALLALVPQREEVAFSAKYHKDLLADKAKILKDFQNDYNVQVNVPKKSENEADFVSVIGTRENIKEAREALGRLLEDLERTNFTAELGEGVNLTELIPFLRGRNGVEAERLSKKFDVRLDFSKKGEPDRIVIRGVREKVEACETFLRKKIEDEESKLSQEVSIDSRVHSRIIGGQGKTLAKIQEKYKVEIKFQGRNNDVVIVKGSDTEQIEDACEHLKNLEEEYLQDVIDREMYTHPSSKSGSGGSSHDSGKESKGFVVRGAPWEQQHSNHNSPKHQNGNANNSHEPVPDTNNMDLFPTISAATDGAAARTMTWGPLRK